LLDEIKHTFFLIPPNKKINTLYFGGGTPSLYPLENYSQIFSLLSIFTTLDESTEISIECDPGTFSSDYLKSLKSLGFNRISLGIQSFDANTLFSMKRSQTL
jgi:oxygen-independent coproporphyrinogen-3 oxidase